MNTIIFVRHGQALPGKIDLERALSDDGKCQAVHRGAALSPLHAVDVVITSPATRAQATAKIVFSADVWDLDKSLYAACTARGMAKAYADLGADVPPAVWRMMYPYLWEVCVANARKARRRIQSHKSAQTIAVVAHEVILNAVALQFAETEQLRKLIMEFPVPECGAISITNEGRSIAFHT